MALHTDIVLLLQDILQALGGGGGTPSTGNTTLTANGVLVSSAAPLPVTVGPAAEATPSAPVGQTITTGGTSQVVFAAGALTNLGIIQNPPTATESLFVCGSGVANTTGLGGTFTLLPGQSFNCPPSTLAWNVNAITTGHAFTAEGM